MQHFAETRLSLWFSVLFLSVSLRFWTPCLYTVVDERPQRTKLSYYLSNPLVNDFGALQGIVITPHIFINFLTDLPDSPGGQVPEHAGDVMLCQSVSSRPEFASLSGTIGSIQSFSSGFRLHLNSLLPFLACLFQMNVRQ